MTIEEIVQVLENWAPLHLSESYDNAGLITGDRHWEVNGILLCLDSIESVIQEAIDLKCNLVIAHHPIVFKGLKKITGSNYVERTVIKAIKHDIAIYAIHTNLDNIITGVNARISELLQLSQASIFQPSSLPPDPMQNITGAGIVGILPQPLSGNSFLSYVREKLKLPLIKHTLAPERLIQKIAVCGGSGSFLIPQALKTGVDALITSDLKYHEYFDADNQMMLLDIGHFESERYTIDLIADYLQPHTSGLKVFKTAIVTNPVHYFL